MKALNQYFDHTLLKPEANAQQIVTLCQEALEYQFYSVCINPFYVPLCQKLLKNSQVKICTVIGFPLGANTLESKYFEAQQALQLGAHELDMVMNVGAFKSSDFEYVESEIRKIVSLEAPVKVILETALLTKEEIVKACQLALSAQAAFVKTSTGFASCGALTEHIQLMRQTVGDKMGVKASGGIRDKKAALAMIQAGANRIGASSGVAIMKDETSTGDY